VYTRISQKPPRDLPDTDVVAGAGAPKATGALAPINEGRWSTITSLPWQPRCRHFGICVAASMTPWPPERRGARLIRPFSSQPAIASPSRSATRGHILVAAARRG